MRFGLTQKVLTFSLALTAAVPLLMSGEVGVGFVVAFFLLFAAGWFIDLPLAENRLFRRGVTGVAATVMAVQLVRLFTGAPMAMLGMELITVLLGAKLITRARATDDNQIVILSFLHIIAATVAMTDLVYGASFLLFVALSSPMLALSYLRQEIEHRFASKNRRIEDTEMVARLFNSKRIVSLRFLLGSALLTVPILLITALLFVIFPRIGFGFMGKITDTSATAGFGNEVVLGDMDIIRLEETVLIRLFPKTPLEKPPPHIDIRLRGAIFDKFDGRKWRKTMDAKWLEMHGDGITYRIEANSNAKTLRRFDILLESMKPTLLFVPEGTGRIHVNPVANRNGISPRKLKANFYGELSYEDTAGVGIQYAVDLTDAPPIGAPPVAAVNYKSLFPGSERLEKLAVSFAGRGSDWEKANRLVRALKSNYRYALRLSKDAKNSAESTPLARFLFSRKSGTCEHFATALTLMLRAVDIPARLITGFSGADWNIIGEFYSVRKRFAHSWTEAFLGGQWTPFDATPSSGEYAAHTRPSTLTLVIDTLRMRWQRHVVSYDLSTQGKLAHALWRRLGPDGTGERLTVSNIPVGPLLGFLVIAIVVGVWIVTRKRLRTKQSAIDRSPRRRRVQKEATSILKALENRLTHLGYRRPPEITPLEHLGQIAQKAAFPLNQAFEALERYNAARFGKKPLRPGEKRVLVARIRSIGRAAKGDDLKTPR